MKKKLVEKRRELDIAGVKGVLFITDGQIHICADNQPYWEKN